MWTPESRGLGGRRTDEGFTLIELLVVIIIIGILAAIAIPVYFNQREKAFNAAMQSDIRTLAQFEESYLVNAGTYATVAQLTAAQYDVRASKNVTVSLRYQGGVGYCLTASHPQSTTTWYYDSRGGGLQDSASTGCPVTTGGIAGGSVTG